MSGSESALDLSCYEEFYMPKIVGFTISLFALVMLVRTVHEALTHFAEHGATSNELWAAIATILGAGVLTAYIFYVLWLKSS